MRRRMLFVALICAALLSTDCRKKPVVDVDNKNIIVVNVDSPTGPTPTIPTAGPGEFNVDLNSIRCDIASNGEHNVFIAWFQSAGAASFEVERFGGPSNEAGRWNLQRPDEFTSFNGNTFAQRRVRPDFAFNYRVWAVNAFGRRLGNPQEFAVCRATFVPACRNTRNDDPEEDNLIDALDPGCHPSDGNPNNPNSYDPNHNSERNPPTGTGPGPGPAPGPGGPAPPTGGPCSGMSFTVGATSGPRGSSTPYSLFAPAGCQVVFESDNTHVGAPSSGRVYFYNPGNFNVCLRSVANLTPQKCTGMTTTP